MDLQTAQKVKNEIPLWQLAGAKGLTALNLGEVAGLVGFSSRVWSSLLVSCKINFILKFLHPSL